MAKITKIVVTIESPAERVWNALMNPENLKYWLTGFASAGHISGEYGKAGAVSRLTFMERGKEMEVIETATAVIPNQLYSFTMTSAAFSAETDIRLISVGRRTEMVQTTQLYPKQFLMKLLMPLIKGAMKNRTKKELDCFKKFVETGT